jgi:hypothetical protein
MYIFSNSFFYSLYNNLIQLLLLCFSKGYSVIFVFNNQFLPNSEISHFNLTMFMGFSLSPLSPCRPSLYLLVSLIFHFPFAPLLFSPLLDPMSHFPISPFSLVTLRPSPCLPSPCLPFSLSPLLLVSPLLVPLSSSSHFPLLPPLAVPLSRIDLCSSTILMFPSA